MRIPLVLCLLVPGGICAQAVQLVQPARRTLTTPEAVAAIEFTSISGARELADGRVIVADGLERTLQVVDFIKQTATPVGRSGAGPAEWQSPSSLFAVRGDSTIMEDVGNDRYFMMLPDAKPGPVFRLPVGSIGVN